MRSVLANRPGEEFEHGWGRKAEDLQDIYQTAVFLGYATLQAHTLAAGSLVLTSVPDAGLTEEERWLSGRAEPNDPLYQEVSKALRVLHACLIREVFDWPGIPMPDACHRLRTGAGLPAASFESKSSMTFEKWQQCVYPNLMLRYLRGDVPKSERAKGGFGGGWSGGTIYPGPSPHAAREECAELGRRVSLLWSITENQPGDELKDMWGRKAADLNDLYETAWFLDCAAVAAYTLAAGSMAFTCAAVTEDEQENWGWGCGPDDPLWDAAREALRVLHACLIREVFIYPDILMPDTD